MTCPSPGSMQWWKISSLICLFVTWADINNMIQSDSFITKKTFTPSRKPGMTSTTSPSMSLIRALMDYSGQLWIGQRQILPAQESLGRHKSSCQIHQSFQCIRALLSSKERGQQLSLSHQSQYITCGSWNESFPLTSSRSNYIPKTMCWILLYLWSMAMASLGRS